MEKTETVTLVNGYDRNKNKQQITFRRFTLDDVKRVEEGHEFWFQANDGTARRLRRSSRLRRWARYPERFECSFKYGLYESVRWDTREMMSRLLIEIDNAEVD